ncbi:MAG: hypothetical protein PHI19_00415 [Clostridia bacterium]|nr:hypothetical protein [Clostridia bacterium]
MKPIRWLTTVLISIVVGMVLAVGGIALTGYIMLTKAGMVGTIEDKVGDKVPDLDLSDELRAMSLLDYGKQVYSQFQKLDSATIAEIEEAIGYSALSSNIASSLEIDVEVIRASTFPDLPQCIIDSIKVRTLQESFGVEFPEFPLFEDEAFLDKQLTAAFADLGDETLDKFITVVYEDDPDLSKPRSSKFMQKLGVIQMTELSDNMDGILADTTIGELITVDENSEPIIKALRDVKLNSNDLNQAIADLTVADVFKNYDSGVISIIPSDTLLTAVPTVLTTTIKDTNLYRLIQLGVYNVNLSSASPEQKASLYNKSPNSVLREYAAILAAPENAATIIAPRVFNVSGVITQATLSAFAYPSFRNGDILVLNGDAEIPADTVFTSVFNIETNGFNLTIGSGVAIDNNGGYMYIKDYTGAPVTISSVQTIRKTPTVEIDAVEIRFI